MVTDIRNELEDRILVLDGAMGTEIQKQNLTESDFRGEQFRDHTLDLMGNNDVLPLTRPNVIGSIHESYLEAGADIIETDTFGANGITQQNYGLEDAVYEMNLVAARIAREAADEFSTPEKPRFVAGSIGPTDKMASRDDDEDSSKPAVTFMELVETYTPQVQGLIDGGVDTLLVETIDDTINAKAALYAIAEVQKEKGTDLPIMISGSIQDSGRTIADITPEALRTSLSHASPLSFGFNCALGAEQLLEYVEAIQQTPTFISVYPNAGVGNAEQQSSEEMTATLQRYMDNNLVNIVGGCCGTTPEYIRMFAELVEGVEPRKVPEDYTTRLSGFEETVVDGNSLIVFGEKTNASGSRRYKNRMNKGNIEGALDIGREQVELGAYGLDVNVDELDHPEERIIAFLRRAVKDEYVGAVPIMIDSTKWSVTEAALQVLPGRSVVNSINLEEGDEVFLQKAGEINKYGAAIVVRAADEEGDAETYERIMSIVDRADKLLAEAGIARQNVFYDPNVFSLGTGGHDNAVDFLNAIESIKQKYEGAHVIAGISNAGRNYRGTPVVYQAINATLLELAQNRGLDAVIADPAAPGYDDIDKDLTKEAENKLLGMPDKLDEIADSFLPVEARQVDDSWREGGVDERLAYALRHGVQSHLIPDLEEAVKEYGNAFSVLQGPLQQGMEAVGDAHQRGLIRDSGLEVSAAVMEAASDYLKDASEGQDMPIKAVMTLATVHLDNHTIGLSILSRILEANGYKVNYLGKNQSAEDIVEAARDADMIGLSGMIARSLDYQIEAAEALRAVGIDKPLFIGGAATSPLHAARMREHYDGPIIWAANATEAVEAANAITGDNAQSFLEGLTERYDNAVESHAKSQGELDLLPLSEARSSRRRHYISITRPDFIGMQEFKALDIEQLVDYIDWNPYARNNRIPNPDNLSEEERIAAGTETLNQMVEHGWVTISGVVGIQPASGINEDIIVYSGEERDERIVTIPTLRQQMRGLEYLSLADFVGEEGYIGALVVAADAERKVSELQQAGKPEEAEQVMLLADRFVNAAADRIHEIVRKELWGYAADESLTPQQMVAGKYKGIRPATGYPSLPDLGVQAHLQQWLHPEQVGITISESGSMNPQSAVAALMLPNGRYFSVRQIGEDQLADYAERTRRTVEETKLWLPNNVMK